MKYIDIETVKKLMPVNKVTQHKGDCGKVMICGGSIGLTGAVCMASNAALRTGSGLVTAAIPESLNSIYEINLTEVMTLPLEDENGQFSENSYVKALEFSDKCNAAAIGVGGGKNFFSVTENFVTKCKVPLIVDADAINALSKDTDLLKYKKCDIILTPHTGEMSRLTGYDTDYINSNRIKVAEEFAAKYGVIVVLKGFETVITDGINTYINTTGNEGMATGGSGDVLCGMILAFLGREISCLESSVLGTYIHGMAGDIAKSKFNSFSMIASDIIMSIPQAINRLI